MKLFNKKTGGRRRKSGKTYMQLCLFIPVVITIIFLYGCQTMKTQVAEKEISPSQEISAKFLTIDRVGVSKKEIDLKLKETTNIKFNLSKPADVIVRIYDEEHNVVRNIEENMLPAGFHILKWDGKDVKGQLVPNGVYIYTIKAKNQAGETFVFDKSEDTGGEDIKIEAFHVDKKTKDIYYLLPQAGRVRIRIGVKGGPLLKTLLDWEPRASGEHWEIWDGKDTSGEIILYNNPDTSIIVHAFTLPHNTLIVKGGKNPVYTKGILPAKRRKKGTYRHAWHTRNICHEPKLQIELPQSIVRNGIPVLQGTTPVVIRIDEKDAVHLTNSRYEIVFFIDNIFLFEDEEGYSPFTYLLSTKDILDGEHLITANIVSYDDHIGVATKKVIVENK